MKEFYFECDFGGWIVQADDEATAIQEARRVVIKTLDEMLLAQDFRLERKEK